MSKYLSIGLATIFGAVHFILLGIAWTYIAQHTPLIDWFIENEEMAEWFRVIGIIHDFLLNIILGLPLAILIYLLRPKNYFLYLGLALLPSFIWTHSVWLNDADFIQHWPFIVSGWTMELFCVPIALMIICWFNRTRTYQAI